MIVVWGFYFFNFECKIVVTMWMEIQFQFYENRLHEMCLPVKSFHSYEWWQKNNGKGKVYRVASLFQWKLFFKLLVFWYVYTTIGSRHLIKIFQTEKENSMSRNEKMFASLWVGLIQTIHWRSLFIKQRYKVRSSFGKVGTIFRTWLTLGKVGTMWYASYVSPTLT